MGDIEIKKIIVRIDQKIKSLENAKEVLIKEFGLEEEKQTILLPPKSDTRKDTIEKLLREHGPLPRKQILEMTGIPIGTLAYVLNDKKSFYNKDGKWGVFSKESAPIVQGESML